MATFIQENGRGRLARRGREVVAALRWLGRVAARALGYAGFGVCSLWLGLIELPLRRRTWRGSREEFERVAQRAIHRTTHFHLRCLKGLGQADVRARGIEKMLERPWLIVANHPSILDTPILMSLLPQADFIVAADWGRNPFLRHTVRAAGYPDAEHGAVTVRRAIQRLRAGRTLVVFPEGSRTPPEGLRPFERGAAHIALRSGCDLLPVVIRVHPRSLTKGQRFIDVPEGCPVWEVEVGEPIHPADYRLGDGNSAAARRITAVLQDRFQKEWDRGIC